MNQWINRYAHLEHKVGGGYYALRKTRLGSKLVVADRSPDTNVPYQYREPSIGHNSRRQRILNKRRINVSRD